MAGVYFCWCLFLLVFIFAGAYFCLVFIFVWWFFGVLFCGASAYSLLWLAFFNAATTINMFGLLEAGAFWWSNYCNLSALFRDSVFFLLVVL